VACTRVFEITHGLKKGSGLGADAESVSHPNKYVDRSRELEKEKLESIKKDVKDEDDPMAN
jgi:DNA primase large subunit